MRAAQREADRAAADASKRSQTKSTTTAATAATAAELLPAAGQYVPLPAAATLVGNEPLAAGATKTITVTGANGVPATGQVSAVALSVMAYNPTANGHLTVYGDGTTPANYSTLNYTANHDIINYEITPVSSTGQVKIYTTTATNLYVRLRGYYTSATATTPGATFVPVAPATLVQNVTVNTGQTITFTATGANGIPEASKVAAVAVHVMAHPPTATGYLTLYPAGTPRNGNDLSVRYNTTESTAGYDVIVPSASGEITLYAQAQTHVYVRLRGYFAKPDSGIAGASYVPIAPATLVDNTTLAASGTTTFTAAGANGIPAAAQVAAVAMNQVANTPSVKGFLQSFTAGTTRSTNDATVYHQAGEVIANTETTAPSVLGQISLFDSAGVRALVRTRGYYKKPTTPSEPRNVTAIALDGGGADISWDPPLSDGGAPITGYIVTLTPDRTSTATGTAKGTTLSVDEVEGTANPDGSFTINATPEETTLTMYGLVVGNPYTVTVSANNGDFISSSVSFPGTLTPGFSDDTDWDPELCDAQHPGEIFGTPGPDTIHGTEGDDVICGLGGDDVIYGLGGDDHLDGGSGNDTIYAGEGPSGVFIDALLGRDGDDILWGSSEQDSLFGGEGNDILVAVGGMDTLHGYRGNDVLYAAAGLGDGGVGGDGADVAVLLDGSNDAWIAGADPTFPAPFAINKFDVPLGLSLNPTSISETLGWDAFKGLYSLDLLTGDMCICDPPSPGFSGDITL